MNKSNYTEAILLKETVPNEAIEGLIIMPERIGSDGVGYYDEQASTTYKELVKMGANVSYYTEKCTSIHRFSAGEDEVAKFLIGFFVYGVGSAAFYDGIKTIKNYILSKINKKSKSIVKGRIYIASKSGDSIAWQEYDISGTVDDAIKMIDKIKEIQSDEYNS